MNLRNLAIWGVIILALAGLYSVMNTSQKSANPDITYSQLLQRVGSGTIVDHANRKSESL